MTSPGPSGAASPVPRVGGRVLLIDPSDRVLLIHERIEDGSTHWLTPGGGVEAGEDPRAAARREAVEEVGIALALPDDAPEVLRTRRFWSWAGVTYDQVDHFYLVRLPEAVEPSPAALTAMERETVLGHAWWSVDQLRATDEMLCRPTSATSSPGCSGARTGAGSLGPSWHARHPHRDPPCGPRAWWSGATVPLGGYESALARAGFERVAGADEAGRGACAGPLVVAACILPPGRRGRIDGLDDSKALTAAAREQLFPVIRRRALAYSIVVIPAAEIDAYGLHVANLAGMRRALCTLDPAADYALTDGFPVPGLGLPSTAVWKGDATVACIAAASILAKVTRDSIMTAMHEQWPQYEFARHKGYITPDHAAALTAAGPCPQHRRRYVNVRRALQGLAPVDEPGGGDRPPAELVGDLPAAELVGDLPAAELMGDLPAAEIA